MISISYDNGTDVYLRPTPFISINSSPLKNKMGTMGSNYSITLNGTIIDDLGSPTFINSAGGGILNKFATGLNYVEDFGMVKNSKKLESILVKQNLIRELFAKDGQRVTVKSLNLDKTSIVFYPNILSVNFEEGPYNNICKYTIEMEAPLLFDDNNNIYVDSLMGSTFSPNNASRTSDQYYREANTLSIDNMINRWGGLVEDFNDNWSMEVDESLSQIDIPSSGIVPRCYRITRNMSATGRTFVASGTNSTKRYEAWEQALGFIKKTILEEPMSPPAGGGFTYSQNKTYEMYPGFKNSNLYASGFLNLPSFYKGYNHTRSINFDKTNGSCDVTDTWILASGDSIAPASENYSISVGKSTDSHFTSISINGSILGLSPLHASGYNATGVFISPSIIPESETPYHNAIKKYLQISESGQFGINSVIFKRVKAAAGTDLNSQPSNISLSSNELTGEINYNIEFDNRPLNYFKGVAFESITVNDTYPGDIYAVIPVIGRSTGPILQAIYARTSYNRDVSIELVLDHTDISYGASGTLTPQQNRTKLLMNKPIINYDAIYPIRKQVKDLLIELCPSGEPYVTTYFLKPPTENWLPLEGRYSINLSWEYEKSL